MLFRSGSATSAATIAGDAVLRSQYAPASPFVPTAPVASGGLVLLGGSDGVVRALDAASGKSRWTAYTGGSVRIPPTIAGGRALVGSGDGWAYTLEAATGRLLWRFRAAPVERKIPVYGALLSTWPAASGVLVADGVAYVAAGIVNYDGTHVYALDAASGHIKWQNNSSGHLNPAVRSGVSVEGHLLIDGDKLYLAGGNAVSPAVYALADGKCLNDPELLNTISSASPRGWELYKIGDQVRATGRPFYADPRYTVYDNGVLHKTFVATSGDRDIAWISNKRVACYARGDGRNAERCLKEWGNSSLQDIEPLWQAECQPSLAVAICRNAVVVAKHAELVAFDLESGKPLWTQPLPAAPVPWGLAIDRAGRVLVTLADGQILCFDRPA